MTKSKLLTIIALFGLCFVLQFAAWSNPSTLLAQGPDPTRVHVFHTRDFYEGLRAASPLTPTNMTYHNGTVELTLKTYTIFWAPSGYSIPSDYQTLINRYFSDVGGSRFFNINTQYYQNPGPTYIQNQSSFDPATQTYYDTVHPFPHAGTPADPLNGTDLLNEVVHATQTEGWNGTAVNTLFLVFTPSGVESCADPTSQTQTSCTPGVPGRTPQGEYCGYHSSWTPDGTHFVVYANIPYTSTWSSCWGFTDSPNGNIDADRALSVASHEHFETMTDPFCCDPARSGWYDASGAGEIGDKCAYVYGEIAPGGANLYINGDHYRAQLEWSNADNDGVTNLSGCVKGYPKPDSADLIVGEGHGPNPVATGTNLSYGISFGNFGPDDGQNAVVTIPLPAHTTFQSFTPWQNWSCLTPPLNGKGTITCNALTPFVQGSGGAFGLVVRVNDDTPDGTILSNTVTLNASTGDPNSSNNSATDQATVTCGLPQKPTLLSPAKGAVLTKPRVLLQWSPSNCATYYFLTVQRGSKNGPIVDQQTNLTTNQYKTIRLTAGHKYVWQVWGCNAINCVASVYKSFNRQ